jgi:hypothetical protein
MTALEKTEHNTHVPPLVEAIQTAYPITVKVEVLSTHTGIKTDFRILSVPRPYLVRVEAFVAGWYAGRHAGW